MGALILVDLANLDSAIDPSMGAGVFGALMRVGITLQFRDGYDCSYCITLDSEEYQVHFQDRQTMIHQVLNVATNTRSLTSLMR